MDEWWTYELEDLILFTSHTYYRLIELYNLAVWPIHLLAILFAAALLFLVIKRPLHHGKIIVVILVLSWFWVAWEFLWQRFASIHWIASYFALAFKVQCLLLLWFGIVKNQFVTQPANTTSRKLGFAILLFAIFIQPFLMILAGQNWKQLELFAITPDSTAMATIGLLLLTNAKNNGWLFIIPLSWCVISIATLYVLQSISAAGLLLVFFATVFALIFNKMRSASLSE